MSHLKSKSTLSLTLLIASAALLLTGCENFDDRTTQNTGLGAAAGAVVGGVVGHQSGHAAEGAALGAAAGGAGGYGYSKATDEERASD